MAAHAATLVLQVGAPLATVPSVPTFIIGTAAVLEHQVDGLPMSDGLLTASSVTNDASSVAGFRRAGVSPSYGIAGARS